MTRAPDCVPIGSRPGTWPKRGGDTDSGPATSGCRTALTGYPGRRRVDSERAGPSGHIRVSSNNRGRRYADPEPSSRFFSGELISPTSAFNVTWVERNRLSPTSRGSAGNAHLPRPFGSLRSRTSRPQPFAPQAGTAKPPVDPPVAWWARAGNPLAVHGFWGRAFESGTRQRGHVHRVQRHPVLRANATPSLAHPLSGEQRF